MKMLKSIKIAVVGGIALLLVTFSLRVAAQPGGMVSFQLFYDQLSPYGEWVNDPEYGFIWLPDVGRDFMPYATNGYWVMTKYGNTWVSNYAWGWAPFHYGRWVHTDWYGWAWIPDYEWGPAWVTWRSGGGYYGWAPLGPGMSISVNIRIPSFHWVFVPNRYITSPHLHRYYAPHRNRVAIYNRTTIINNIYVYNNRTYISGPARRDIERVTRSRVNVREIRNSAQPRVSRVSSRSIDLYRPTIDRNTRAAARPARVADVQTVRGNADNRAGVGVGTKARVGTSTRAVERGTSTRAIERGTLTRAIERGTTTQSRTTDRGTTNRATNTRAVERGTSTRAVERGTTTQSRTSTDRNIRSTTRQSREREAVKSSRTESNRNNSASQNTRGRRQ